MISFIYILWVILIGFLDLASGWHEPPTCTYMGSPDVAQMVIMLLIVVLMDTFLYVKRNK